VDGIALPNSSFSSTYGGVIDFPNTGLDKNDFQKRKKGYKIKKTRSNACSRRISQF
jgi:hypothetical protein